MISIEYVMVAFTDVFLNAFDIPKLRGYFARKYPEEPLLHNHLEGSKVSYRYPRIQYRIYQGHPAILAIHEGIDVLQKIILDNHQLQIGNKSMMVNEMMVVSNRAKFGQTANLIYYKFKSPWMALNQENYKEYVKMATTRQEQRLKQILKGNLLTISKGFNYTIPNIDEIAIEGSFHPVSRNFHNVPMHCFSGQFSLSFMIPEYLALGKQVSRGFGTIVENKDPTDNTGNQNA